MRCIHCEYLLHGLAERRCPECGCGFDPDDPQSTLPDVPPEPTLADHLAIAAWMFMVCIVIAPVFSGPTFAFPTALIMTIVMWPILSGAVWISWYLGKQRAERNT